MDMLLTLLKTDLGIRTSTAYDDRLRQLLISAKSSIIKEGATSIDEFVPDDGQLIVMYAAWLWRRRDEMNGMPRMLRWALNNRIFSEKAGAVNG